MRRVDLLVSSLEAVFDLNMIIITYRNIFFALTGVVVLAAITSLAIFGLRVGTDFTGGTLVRVTYDERPTPETIVAALEQAELEGFSLREVGEADYMLRAGALTEKQRGELPAILSGGEAHKGVIAEMTEVGPTIGAELRTKAIISMIVVLLCILLFIAFAFRKVSKPISSWLYGCMAIVALVFNVLVTCGFFAFLGYLTGVQVDTLFVTALLTILGFSIHDTIVVFDRTRENLRLNEERGLREDFAEVAGRSLNQTIVRSINTSVTIALSLTTLYVLGPASTKDFALTMLVGIIAGTYSSIALATPLLVAVEKRKAQ